jgi:hypothetical protein
VAASQLRFSENVLAGIFTATSPIGRLCPVLSEGGNLMEGSPFHTLGVANLANNETLKEIKLPKAPQNKLFVVEFVGINGFVQPNQHLFVSLNRSLTIIELGKGHSA